MTSSDFITIILNPNKENEVYRPTLRNLTEPIYLVGDSIVGRCRVVPQNGERVRHRGISVRLIGKYTAQGIATSQFSVYEQRIADPGDISQEMYIPFTFDKPTVNYPSYHGVKYCLLYSLVVDVKTGLFSTSSKSEQIVFLEPTKLRPAAQNLSVSISQPPLIFWFRIDKSHYATDDMVNGQLNFGKVPAAGLQSVTVCLIRTERYRDGSQNRFEDTTLLAYELVDGAPKPEATIPFFIQLAPLQIWTAKSNPSSVITTEFRLDVFVKRNDGERRVEHLKIQISQRLIPQT
jgi:hypothetical protein